MKYTTHGTLYWFVPIHELLPSGERTEELISKRNIFGFKNSLGVSRKLKVGGIVCFYSLERQSIILKARIKAGPSHDPIRISEVYPYVIELDDVRVMTPRSSVIDRSFREKLDAFKGNTKIPWGWFVRRPQRLSEHDFDLLTSEEEKIVSATLPATT